MYINHIQSTHSHFTHSLTLAHTIEIEKSTTKQNPPNSLHAHNGNSFMSLSHTHTVAQIKCLRDVDCVVVCVRWCDEVLRVFRSRSRCLLARRRSSCVVVRSSFRSRSHNRTTSTGQSQRGRAKSRENTNTRDCNTDIHRRFVFHHHHHMLIKRLHIPDKINQIYSVCVGHLAVRQHYTISYDKIILLKKN